MTDMISECTDAMAHWNYISSIGAFISFASIIFWLIFLVFGTLLAGRRVGRHTAPSP